MPYRNPAQQRRANRAVQRRRRDRQKEQAFELEEEQYENATLRAEGARLTAVAAGDGPPDRAS